MELERDTSHHAFLAEAGNKNTRELRRRYVGEYVDWLQENGLTALSATAVDIAHYLDERCEGLKPSSRDGVMYSLRAYYEWLTNLGALPANPMSRMRARQKYRSKARHVTVDELRAVLESARSKTNWALIAALAFHSLEVGELVSCDADDLIDTPEGVELRYTPHGRGEP